MRKKLLPVVFVLGGCAQAAHGTWDDAGNPAPSNDGAAPIDAAKEASNDAGTLQSPDASEASAPVDAGYPSGWLYTQGGTVNVSNGTSGTQWMGRGVNFDDVYLCGYNYTLWMTDPETTLTTMAAHVVTEWKPTFVRISLGMNSNPTTVSWTSGNAATYKTPMTNLIDWFGSQGVYVLVTLRSDVTMTTPIDEATFVPTNATDPVYQAIVDTFAHSSFVMFGISNEPGGNALSDSQIRAAMDHAVSTIRTEEDKLGVPHHLVSVQGNDWTSNISFYAQNPLPYDNVVYEVHGYPPPASSYTYSNIPVIIGEYGSLSNPGQFYADVESKHVPTLAWDLDSYSNCAPDLVSVNQSASNLVPTAWGQTVKAYLISH
jgi:hypothetical protein